MQIAIDTGGTFTDCICLEDAGLKVLKIFSTPADPGAAVAEAVRMTAKGNAAQVRHGTTVGTNALLERKGARVAFVTTAGFEDVISIGRQARARLYDWFATPPPCIVPPELRFGVAERTAAGGSILRRPDPADLRALAEKIKAGKAEAIAICLLFSFANPENEIAVARALDGLGLPISLSHIILPEFREYERASTVTVNAYLAPRAGSYLQRLDSGLRERSLCAGLEVMQSSGGIIPAGFAAQQPVRTVLSGPAGGVTGAYHLARSSGFSRIITLDMGGTSTDVCLVDGAEGGPRSTIDASISNLPISVPMLDIHTIGAGGGSLAHFDPAGILHVGPESAGADPGPICYGRGAEPTVSDANLLLGRLHPEHFLDGELKLDPHRTRLHMEKARGPLATVEEFSSGIVRLAEAAMERAIRLISVERGHDPREFTLVAFGGAGPLHACALAEALRMPRVLVPAHPGALSALGILLADAVRDYSRTVMLDPDADLEPHFLELEKMAAAESPAAAGRAFLSRSADLRYAGQGYELNVPAGPDFLEKFHHAHRKRYGHADESKPVEIVNVRLRATLPGEPMELPTFPPGDGNPAQALLETRAMIFEKTLFEKKIFEKTPSAGKPSAEAPSQAAVFGKAGEIRMGKVYRRELLEPGDRLPGPALVVEYSATTVVAPGWALTVDPRKNLVMEVEQ